MVKKVSKEQLIDNLSLELRRGALTLAILSQLDSDQYGYSLKQSLSDQGLEINEGTLYPLLRRLEEQGLLQSNWQVVDGKRPRRYYRLSATGETILANLSAEWQQQVKIVNHLLGLNNR
jgi:PadR family transcriptional regulator PadR